MKTTLSSGTHSQFLKRGSTLIAVFWLLSILGLALFSTITLVNFESDLAATQSEGSRAGQFAEMGIAVAANPVVSRGDPLLRQIFEDGNAGFEAEIESEADKFDINLILAQQNPELDDKGWLREIFIDWGMDPRDAQALIDALVDWVDDGDLEELNGAERPYYEGRGFNNRPFNRPFYDLNEMRFVRGMDLLEQVNPNWRDFFTIWTQSGIDLNEASAEIMSLALNLNFDEANRIVELRNGPDGLRGTDDDPPPFGSVEEVIGPGPTALVFMTDTEFQLTQHRVSVNSATVRLQSLGWSGDIRRRITLILRNREGNATLLERREEIVQ